MVTIAQMVATTDNAIFALNFRHQSILMKLEYIAYGFSRVIICTFIGIILGTFLVLLNVDNNISLIISVIVVNILLVHSGYFFAKNQVKKRYRKSLFLALIISFFFSLVFFLFKSSDFNLALNSFINLFSCLSIGIFIHFLRFDLKSKSDN